MSERSRRRARGDSKTVAQPEKTIAAAPGSTRRRRRTLSAESQADRKLRRVISQFRRRGDGSHRFVEEFYRHLPTEEAREHAETVLRGFALSAWTALQERPSGNDTVVRVYNPGSNEIGCALDKTLIEVVTADCPFLVESVTAALNRLNITVHLAIHPVVRVRRDEAGRLLEVLPPGRRAEAGALAESIMQLHIDPHSESDALAQIAATLRSVIADVQLCVADWGAMQVRIDDAIAEIRQSAPPLDAEEIEDAIELLRWIANDHFTFIGYRDYRFVTENGRTRIEVVPESGLGILRAPEVVIYENLLDQPHLPAEVAAFLLKPALLTVGKANRRSTVQRSSHLDTIALRRFDEHGNVVGGRLFAGLFTSIVFTSSPRQIPLLRRKVAAILAASGFDPKGHDGRGLLHVLETLPRDELFQVDTATLLQTCLGILRLRDRQRVALFVHRDPLLRNASCLVYVPRDRFDTRLRLRLGRIVADGFGGELIAFHASVSSDPMARVQFLIRTVPGVAPPLSAGEIEQQLREAARDWREDLRSALERICGRDCGRSLFQQYADAFPASYRDDWTAEDAVGDIARTEQAIASGAIVLHLYRRPHASADELRLKLYRSDRPQPLSDVLPVLEKMGVRVLEEIPYRITRQNVDREVWVHDFGMTATAAIGSRVDSVRELFESAMGLVCRGDTDNDGFNALVLGAGLAARRIVILRAYCKFLLQSGIGFSQAYIEATLVRHAPLARHLVELFEVMFDPAAQHSDAGQVVQRLRRRIRQALDAIPSLDEDRILRRIFTAIEATLRTNYFQRDASGGTKPYLSLKLNSQALEYLPLPRPFVEVFVHSARVDAVHLRGGLVARGGIRWSDRREDLRTEILGLMKSQMTKNAVIVPGGAKGGFIVKRPPTSGERDALQAEAVECYKTMIRGLLDITDNREGDRVVVPADVVRRDGDDSYLVVAADKGTASFSDIANAVAAEYDFWLGDAFASGGSAGYDHKAIGITARGAWESIKRHFREMGTDAMRADFTCVGVGDMSGDVFGNGALYSRHMRLVAAFNHSHIFVDPTPDAAASWKERKRLFDLPRSSWSDYDASIISRGGGVFERAAKSIRVSRAMRTVFDLGAQESITPGELIRAILRCRVDLLYFGGIGTYVRSSQQSDAEVGDRANDAIRVRARDVRARVIGEGANLAITQLGRIEYAFAGGRINTDFIDNSGGVDCSDREVNIKIALQAAMAQGALTRARRDRLLRGMTEEVAALVLRDNYRQSGALSEAERQSRVLLDDHARFITALERSGRIDRGVEQLPDSEQIEDRRERGRGLTRPELAVLLAYAKNVLRDAVLASDLPDDPYLANGIGNYFPNAMRRRFADTLAAHPLRREITATYVANSIVNRVGPGFITSVQERSGANPAAIARAYLVCREVFRLAPRWRAIDELDHNVPAAAETEMRLAILDLIRRTTRWFVRTGAAQHPIEETVAAFAPATAVIERGLDRLLSASRRRTRDQRAQDFAAHGVPPALARRIANLEPLAATCDIVRIASASGVEPQVVARAHFELGTSLGIDWLRESASPIAMEADRWRKAAALGLVDDLFAIHADLTSSATRELGREAADPDRLAAWQQFRGYGVDRSTAIISELRGATTLDLPMLTVATASLRALTAGR